MDMFKVRYSWGKVGNAAIDESKYGRFPFLYEINESTDGYQWADFNLNNWYAGKNYKKVATTAATWEVAKKHDVGVDFSLFKDRFMLTVDYFYEQRDGIFAERNYLPFRLVFPPKELRLPMWEACARMDSTVTSLTSRRWAT